MSGAREAAGTGALRVSEGAIAVIGRRVDNRVEWLVRWNRKWGWYASVGGHREPDETFRACMIREIVEELEIGLDAFTVSDRPLARLEFVDWSVSAGVETAYAHELFAVRLDAGVAARLARDGRVRWVTRDAIRRGLCPDGTPISNVVARHLNAIDWQWP